jgi:hypothetical protein
MTADAAVAAATPAMLLHAEEDVDVDVTDTDDVPQAGIGDAEHHS